MGIEKLKYENMKVNTQPKRRISEQKNKRINDEIYERNRIRKINRQNKNFMKRTVFFVSMIFILAVVTLVRFNSIYSTQGQISTLKSEIKTVTESNEALNIQISEGVSLEKLEKIASERLDMIYPNRNDAINIIR
ncbi:MAG: hypothetical protein ACRC57_06030 [Sarcina sp.]